MRDAHAREDSGTGASEAEERGPDNEEVRLGGRETLAVASGKTCLTARTHLRAMAIEERQSVQSVLRGHVVPHIKVQW